MATDIPGIKAKHAIITDECRENKGDMLAIEEALDRIREEYFSIVNHRDDNDACDLVDYHVVLVVDDHRLHRIPPK